MADEDKNLSSLPAAIGRRQRVISLEGGVTVIVEKFSITKMIHVFEYLTSLFKDVDQAEIEALKGNSYSLAAKIIGILGDKSIGLIKLCVRKDDADKVTDSIDADEAFEILCVAIELNLTDKLAKKASELKARFGPLFGGGK